MIVKWIGAFFVVMGCGGFGFAMAKRYLREENALCQIIHLLDYMECELKYRMTPLPQLFRHMGEQGKGCVRRVFFALSSELDACLLPDADRCMKAVLSASAELPGKAAEALGELGASLGHFDLDGQARQIQAIRLRCEEERRALRENRDVRTRSYQTLGICAGAALAILLV